MRKPEDIKIGNYTLEEILERHQHWLNEDCENWENMQADLSGADLSGVDMRYADMRYADLNYADLSYADLSGADLSYADLSYANMSCADMRYACQRYADMRDADMRGADLSNAKMSGANICGAKMSDDDQLRQGVKLSEPIIGWKKCKNNVLVKLEIPRGAIVFSINNSKCRADKAKVLEIIGGNRAYSKCKFFSYYVGDVIEIFDFNCEYNVECAKGIHFFKTREEAENY